MQDPSQINNQNPQYPQPSSTPPQPQIQQVPNMINPTVRPVVPVNPQQIGQAPTPQTVEVHDMTQGPSQMYNIDPTEVGGMFDSPLAPQKGQDEDASKRKKKLIIIAIAIGSIFSIIVAGTLVYLFTKPSDVAIFQKSINKAASITSVQKEVSIDGAVQDVAYRANVSLNSDVSDPSKPKTNGTIFVEMGVYGIPMKINSDFICVSEQECFIKYNAIDIPKELSANKPSNIGQWLQFNPYNPSQVADPFRLVAVFNTVLGEIIMGNITDGAKDAIAATVKGNTAYKVDSVTTDTVNDKKAKKYEVSLNGEDIVALNKTVADQYKIVNPKDGTDINDKISIWVNGSNSELLQYQSEKDGLKTTVQYKNYNKAESVSPPESYLTDKQYQRVL